MFKPHKIRQLINDRKLIDKKFSMKDFCQSIDLTNAALMGIIERGAMPKVNTLESIAAYFGKDMNYFFDQGNSIERKQMVSSPVEIYEPSSELAECYKIMYEQQKQITELTKEVEYLKNGHAPMNGAQAG